MGEQKKPLVLVELEQTCGACPSQWEGKTEDGQAIYIRYRHGEFTVGLGTDQDEAVDASAGWNGKEPYMTAEPDVGDGGWMTTEEMLTLTGFTLKEVR